MSTNSFAKTGSVAWWLTLVKGILLVVFGVWLIQSPGENLLKLSLVFGLLILSGGLLEVSLAFNNRKINQNWEWALISGVFDILLGAFLIANPAIILMLITILISLWLLFRGVIAIRNAVILKKANNQNYKYGLIFGIVLILLAAIFVWHPEVVGITIAFWTAMAFISLGIFRIILVINYPVVKK
jgi:uncharacterized membrane protein HdeD (DUF308 family)